MTSRTLLALIAKSVSNFLKNTFTSNDSSEQNTNEKNVLEFFSESINGNRRREQALYLNITDKTFEALQKIIDINADFVITTEKEMIRGKYSCNSQH